MTVPLKERYEQRLSRVLVPVAALLQPLIEDHMKTPPEVQRIDRISVRPKSVKSFMGKSRVRLKRAGKLRYSDPLDQIQDQIGARIIVFYEDDIQSARERVTRYFSYAEQKVKEPESEWEFGYFGVHFILSLPLDAIPKGIEREAAPTHFELQIRTLFQHAWSEAEHDLIYKATVPVTSEHKTNVCICCRPSMGCR